MFHEFLWTPKSKHFVMTYDCEKTAPIHLVLYFMKLSKIPYAKQWIWAKLFWNKKLKEKNHVYD